MRAAAVIAGCLALLAGVAMSVRAGEPRVSLTAQERAAILAHGPWPSPAERDPSNRVSGDPDAVALGRMLFFDVRLSRDGDRSCATCHDPARHFSDRRPRAIGLAVGDRNTIALANLRLNRWFGWAGAADSLWAQSLRPILDAKELGVGAALLQARLAGDVSFAATYRHIFGREFASLSPEAALVDLAKALAAFQETITTGRTPFDDFRDALARGDAAGMARYPEPALRGLKLFIGSGRCSTCHHGPNFTNGEFDDIGIPFFAEAGRVDPGRYAGIASLRASPYSLTGPFSDAGADIGIALPTHHMEQQHRNWGEFRVPSLRNVARTAPYMHDGSLATLADVVRHYSEIDVERLHGDDGARLIRPLLLSAQEAADLVSFLETLSEHGR